jgi:hypothetical protein
MKKEDFLVICRSKAKQPLTAEDESFLGSIGEAIEKALGDEATERNKKLSEIETKLGGVEDGETFAGIIRTLATKLDELEAKTKRGFSSKEKFQLRKMLEDKKSDIQAAMRDKSKDWSIEFRAKRAASALMTSANTITGSVAIDNPNFEDDLEVVVIQYPKNFILDSITSRQVANVPATKRIKKQTTAGTGEPGVISEGATKTLVDKKLLYEYFYRQKYAGRIEYTEEFEMDFGQLVIDIITMFEDEVIRKWQDGVLAAIVAWAPAYTSTSLDGTIVNPTVYAVIGAGKLCVQDKNYDADILIINPGDAAEAIYLQDNNGNQQFIPSELQFGGLMPFISNKIDAGTILVGTKRTVQEQHSAFIVRNGQYGNQLIENEYTVIGEVFSLLTLPSTVSNYSWCKLDIATVKDALRKEQA